MKKIFGALSLLLLVSSFAFGQLTLNNYLNDWKMTKESLKAAHAKNGIKETTKDKMTFVFYKDKFNGADVDVTYIYEAGGKLSGKIMQNSTPNTKFFDLLLKAVVSACGNKYEKNAVNGMDTYKWTLTSGVVVGLMNAKDRAQLFCGPKGK